jgi:phosphoesterase RecJ-like protein
MTELFEKCKSIFQQEHSFVLTTHVNPDGDGLGSEVALAAYLRSLGKETVIINQSETPSNYLFLHSIHPVEHFSRERHANVIANADVIIVADTNSPLRFTAMKDLVLQSKAQKICIDHHLDQAEFANLYLIDESSPATGEIVYRLLSHLDPHVITRQIADALYVAIMTDTGSFRFPKTDIETHGIIAELLARGVDPSALYQKVFEEGSINKLKLLGKALESLKTAAAGKVAYMVLSRSAFAETGTVEADTDTMINQTMSIGGVVIGLLFVELEDGVKVSFRSKGNVAANELAKEFGGNGHKNAAGARQSSVKLNDFVEKVVERAAVYARRQ